MFHKQSKWFISPSAFSFSFSWAAWSSKFSLFFASISSSFLLCSSFFFLLFSFLFSLLAARANLLLSSRSYKSSTLNSITGWTMHFKKCRCFLFTKKLNLCFRLTHLQSQSSIPWSIYISTHLYLPNRLFTHANRRLV